MSTLAVRPALPQDEIFLYELYRAIRGPQFEQTALTPPQREHMLQFQFRAQLSSYTQQYPNSCYHIVLLDSKPCGRLWVAPGQQELHLVDIAMHPSVQSKGVGTALVQRLQQEAQQLRVPITSVVDRFNPGSFRFHKRLGFTIVREDQMNYFMEWRAAPLVG
ncbi:MAG TPA: GNAT family N-acetyltransferase [Bryobacteraceae bacterium]|jgi:ribosomal protein S18 acetylase RimI-like enzyme